MISSTKALFTLLLAAALIGTLGIGGPGLAQSGSDKIAEAREALARGDAIAAEVALKDAVRQGATRSAVAARMGQVYLELGEPERARDWLEPERFVPAERALGFRMLARLRILDGKLPEAGQAFDRALEFAPDDADLWIDIARLRYRGGEHVQAREAVIHALSLDQSNVRALEFRGQLARDAQGLRAALPWFEKALEIEPRNLAVMGEYAATLGDVGRYRDMLTVVRQMAEIDPRLPRIHFLQAVLAARAGNTDLAKRLMNRTDGAYDEVPAGILLNAAIDIGEGNPGLAAEALVKLANKQPGNRRVGELLALALFEADEMPELVSRFEAPANEPEASPYLLTLVGRAHEALGEREKAAAYLDRAARVPAGLVVPSGEPTDIPYLERQWIGEPGNVDKAAALARALIADRRAAAAVAVGNGITELHPGSIDAQIIAGDAKLAVGDTLGALAHYESAAKVRLTYSLAEKMARAEHALGRHKRAEALARRYTRGAPLDREAALLHAAAAREAGMPEAASVSLRRAIALPGGDRDFSAKTDLSSLLTRLKLPSEAAEAAQASYTLQPMSGEATARFAAALRDSGNDELVPQLTAKRRALSRR